MRIPDVVTRAMKELPQKVNKAFIQAALGLAHKDFAAKLAKDYKWALFPANPTDALNQLVDKEITEFVYDRNANLYMHSEYVFGGNSPRAMESNYYPWHKIEYSLDHDLNTEFQNEAGEVQAKLMMSPYFNSQEQPRYRWGRYFEYGRDEQGRINQIVFVPVEENGQTSYRDNHEGLYDAQQVVTVDYISMQGHPIALETAKSLNIRNIKEVSNDSIKDSQTQPQIKKGHLYLLENTEAKPEIGVHGFINFKETEQFDVYFENGETLAVVNESNIKRLQKMGYDVDSLAQRQSTYTTTLHYFILPIER